MSKGIYTTPQQQYLLAILLAIDHKNDIVRITMFLPSLSTLLAGYGVEIREADGTLLLRNHIKADIATVIQRYEGAPFKASLNGDTVQSIRIKRKATTPERM